MFKIPLPELKEKIVHSGKCSITELEERIRVKINELSGLISEEGAAHIIANELGVDLVNQQRDKLKIKEIYAGMRGITAVGKVVRKFDVRQFAKGERTGQVCSLVLGDETGTIRVVFWNDQVNFVEKVQDGDVLLLKDVYVKENNGDREIHVGERTELRLNPEGENIDVVRQNSYQRKKIMELLDGQDNVEIMGTVVQVFDPRFFSVCPECNSRVVEPDAVCSTHGKVLPASSYVVNCILDDGSSTIRGVFWKNQTHHLLGKSEMEMLHYKDAPASFEEVKTDLLGEQFLVRGRVKRNEMFDRLEFSAQLVEKANPEEELARMKSHVM